MARWLIHDLRNPTQALSLITELMDDEPDSGDPGVAKTIEEATSHLSRSLELLDRLLRLPPVTPEPAPLSLADSLHFIAALHRLNRIGVTLDLAAAPETALPAVRGVEQELEQILLNLLLNALDALSGRDGGRIELRVAWDAVGVRVTVADDGPGVAPDARERLFEPFAGGRADRGHAGLGLAVSRALAERHGGSLTYEPDGGSGARFVLTLPRWR